ncbi:MAG: hypothetical protein LJE83_01790 [Gammaproteobacteria bacterium]|jgi:transcriptional antiterminator Rof (Rho-off)|nr:hypothetical protein [Gammaproteobacteria bacterium]
MNQPYQPITCALHDKYEIAIMYKQHIDIKWQYDNGEQHKEKVLPLDLPVKNGEEFLLAKLHDDKELCIRLDRITLIE